MPVTAPPRPPRHSDPIDRAELEALVEALIEEARQRARRRRQKQGAVVTVVTLAALALFTTFGRSAESPSSASEPAARSGLSSGAATSRIAFIREPDRGGYVGVLWVMNGDGRERRRLAPAFPGMRWSPDGRKIAFTDWVRGGDGSGIYVMDADGSGQQRLISGRGWRAWLGELAWSPDGRTIAFSRISAAGRADIYVMNADGGEPRRLTRGTASDANVNLAWSHEKSGTDSRASRRCNGRAHARSRRGGPHRFVNREGRRDRAAKLLRLLRECG